MLEWTTMKYLIALLLLTSQSSQAQTPNWKSLGDGNYINANSIANQGDIKIARLKHSNGNEYEFEFDCTLQKATNISSYPKASFSLGQNIYIDKALDFVCTNKILRLFK